MNVVVDGLMTNYLKIGKGKPIVMLHGWGDDNRTFLPLIDKLKQSYQIYALDLPGSGNTKSSTKEWELEDYANFLEHWLDKLTLKPYAVIGHSFGGAVAVATSGLHKRITDRLILLASDGIHLNRPLWKKLLNQDSKKKLYDDVDIRRLANKINVPTLLVYGNSDTQNPTAVGHVLCRSIKGSRMEIIKAGHLLHQDDPAKVSHLIKEFLSDA